MNDRIPWVTGHAHAVTLLRRSLVRPAHAYLLAGPHRIGKRTLAMKFAQALNCEEGEAGSRPCGVCRSCRLIAQSGHPDVSLLEPVEKERIGIEHVRQIRSQLSLRPGQSLWRVAVVRGDALTDQAGDALLKTLEEPNSQVVLILTTHDLQAIPETIISRCRVVVMGLVPTDVILRDLEQAGVDSAEASRLAALSYGAVGWARAAARDGGMADRREQIRDDLAKWGSASLFQRMAAAESLASSSRKPDAVRRQVMEELEIMMSWWRDILLTVSGQPGLIVNTGARSAIERLASTETVAHAYGMMRSVGEAAARIDANVDPRLALEALAINL